MRKDAQVLRGKRSLNFLRPIWTPEIQSFAPRHFWPKRKQKEKAGELISREVVSPQTEYIFICLRRAILNFPVKYAHRTVSLPSEHEARQLLTKAAHEFLIELVGFPEKCINPNWLEILEGNGDGDHQPRIHPSSGQEIKAEQKKAKIRRQRKTETMRNLHSKGWSRWGHPIP